MRSMLHTLMLGLVSTVSAWTPHRVALHAPAAIKKSPATVIKYSSEDRHPADLNNDGKVDFKDAQHGLTLAALAAIVTTTGASPAAAKGCFVADTPVTMADGSTAPIDSIAVGAAVQSWDVETDSTMNASVLDIVHVQRFELMDITLENGDVVTSTIDHPWWSHSQGAIVSLDPNATEAQYELSGVRIMLNEEVLQDAEGMPVKATIKRRPISKEPVDVMTLKLDRGHWFFTGEKRGVRVHNKGGSHHSSSHHYSRSRRTSSRRRGTYYSSSSPNTFPQMKEVSGGVLSNQGMAPALVNSGSVPVYPRNDNLLNKLNHPLQCINLPEVGDSSFEVLNQVDASGKKNGDAKFTATYSPATVTEANPNTCQYIIKSTDGKTITNEKAETVLGLFAWDFSLLAGLWLTLGASAHSFVDEKIADRRWNKDFAKEFKEMMPLPGKAEVPFSGVYTGYTKESDGTKQQVYSELKFTLDGKVTGQGKDKEDGWYAIDGEWTPAKVKWTEFYEGGPNGKYTVKVKGEFDGIQKLTCRFKSTYGGYPGIGGTFNLTRFNLEFLL
jgi:hypothetical protein